MLRGRHLYVYVRCSAEPSVVLQTHLAAMSISIHALSASLSHSHYCKTVTSVKDLESAGWAAYASSTDDLLWTCCLGHHMQPDVLTSIFSTSEYCSALWSQVQGKRHMIEEATTGMQWRFGLPSQGLLLLRHDWAWWKQCVAGFHCDIPKASPISQIMLWTPMIPVHTTEFSKDSVLGSD